MTTIRFRATKAGDPPHPGQILLSEERGGGDRTRSKKPTATRLFAKGSTRGGINGSTAVEIAEYGWAGLAERVDIRCFRFDPSLNSSLVFLRRTPWARAKVEELYVAAKTRR